ncbi:MAG: nitrilase-related carbon-nitrogen hydrolase, partial [Candidatus Bathyarchaeia archaeon]
MKVAMAQINATVGDINGNIAKIKSYLKLASVQLVDVVAFPELAVTGYPPQDLLYEKEFVKTNKESLLKLVEENKEKEIVGIVGFVDYEDEILYNAAAVFKGNKL